MTEIKEQDMEQLASMGISKDQVLKQITIFKEGIPFVKLENAAVVADGIQKLELARENECLEIFERRRQALDLLKFVPASGAASRMFKALFAFLETFEPDSESLEAYLDRTGDEAIRTFVKGLRDFPFYDLVTQRIRGKTTSRDQEIKLFVAEMLREDQLNFGFYPKGLLPFHRYGTHLATPFEEHLKEAAAYASNGEKAKLHFTISEQHGALFNEEFKRIKERVSAETNTSFEVSYSYQKASTDTLAVTPENQPFREADGRLLFRPGGHGALIENLDEQEGDIIFIKNIDNVVVSSRAGEVIRSKKILGGFLIQLVEKAHGYAAMLEGDDLGGEALNEIRHFLENDLNVRFPTNFNGFSLGEQRSILADKINRPIRVCGMVRNEGEPGGGPFWIRDANGNLSLQIVESAQVDMDNERQKEIFGNATHFNPVDIVCAVKDHKGNKYALQNFVDTKQGFITSKTQEGKPLKALELPGLWNGGMAFWNSVFVEVAQETFNPVKTVNDLLKPAHQAEKI